MENGLKKLGAWQIGWKQDFLLQKELCKCRIHSQGMCKKDVNQLVDERPIKEHVGLFNLKKTRYDCWPSVHKPLGYKRNKFFCMATLGRTRSNKLLTIILANDTRKNICP